VLKETFQQTLARASTYAEEKICVLAYVTGFFQDQDWAQLQLLTKRIVILDTSLRDLSHLEGDIRVWGPGVVSSNVEIGMQVYGELGRKLKPVQYSENLLKLESIMVLSIRDPLYYLMFMRPLVKISSPVESVNRVLKGFGYGSDDPQAVPVSQHMDEVIEWRSHFQMNTYVTMIGCKSEVKHIDLMPTMTLEARVVYSCPELKLDPSLLQSGKILHGGRVFSFPFDTEPEMAMSWETEFSKRSILVKFKNGEITKKEVVLADNLVISQVVVKFTTDYRGWIRVIALKVDQSLMTAQQREELMLRLWPQCQGLTTNLIPVEKRGGQTRKGNKAANQDRLKRNSLGYWKMIAEDPQFLYWRENGIPDSSSGCDDVEFEGIKFKMKDNDINSFLEKFG